jgi:hypothetical protein
MSVFDTNKPTKDTNNEAKPDANKQPLFEPKRVIHRSKPVSNSGDGNRRPASLFRPKPASHPKAGSKFESTPAIRSAADKSVNPDLRMRTLLNGGNDAPPLAPKSGSRKLSWGERTHRAYWDVTASLSLIANAILVSILLIMVAQINSLKTTVNSLLVNGLLNGLYSNFVEMDNASITTTITVNTDVPINFMLPIQQNTDVTLTQNVVIPNAYVVINSGGLSINAPASVTLPAGTTLPIALNMSVPVQSTIPVTLQVPVNIPLAQTELHKPFTGLQDTLRPLYCLLDKNAQYPQGIYICKDHDIPTSTTGVP